LQVLANSCNASRRDEARIAMLVDQKVHTSLLQASQFENSIESQLSWL
jgi:hypothetical protein